MSLDRASRARLNLHTLPRFTGDTLFDRVARALCRAECLPRKELYESWEMARRVRRWFRGGRVIDLAAGHAVLAQLLLLLDDSSPEAIAVDTVEPPSADKVRLVLAEDWPRLAGRVSFVRASIEALPFALTPNDLVVSSHACGALTDRVLDRAIEAGARVAVLPCCHDEATADRGVTGWIDGALAIDLARADRLRAAGYAIRTLRIPEEISPKNRLLLGDRANTLILPR